MITGGRVSARKLELCVEVKSSYGAEDSLVGTKGVL